MKKILIWQFFDANQKRIVKNLSKKYICFSCSYNLNKKNDLGSILINKDALIKNFGFIKKENALLHRKIYNLVFEKYLKNIYSMNFIGFKNYNLSPFDLSKILICQINCIIEYYKSNKIDYLISSPYLCMGHDFLVYYIAKHLNIKTLLLVSQFRNRFFVTTDIVDFGRFNSIPNNFFNKIEYSLRKFHVGQPYYIDTVPKNIFYLMNKSNKYVFKLLFPNPRKLFSVKGYSEYMIKIKNISEHYKKLLFWKQENNRKNIISKLPKKFCFFALHYQPEATTIGVGREYVDQILAIEALASTLPKDMFIIIKEHPAQSDLNLRTDFFYKRIKNLEKKIIFANINDSSNVLVQKSLFVCTITGTIGLEAIMNSKPVLVFGRPWYLSFDGVFLWNKNIDLNVIINSKPSYKKIIKQFNALSTKMGFGVDAIGDWEKSIDVTTGYKKIKYNDYQNCKLISDSIIKLLSSNKIKWFNYKTIY